MKFVLRVPDVYVENMDITAAIARVAVGIQYN